MREALTFRLYAVGWRLVRALPEATAHRLFQLLADVLWRRRGTGVRQLEANLLRAAPGSSPLELRALTRAGMRGYLRYWCDTFRLPDWDRERVVDRVRVIGEEHLRANTGPGQRGVVAALMHMGNWDHAGAWASLTGVSVSTVAERLRPERLFDRFLAHRKSLGMEILPLTGGEGQLLEALGHRLRQGWLVPLLADRDLTGTGLPVTMLGEAARLPAGPAMLALRTGAALHPLSIWHEHTESGRPGIVLEFLPEVAVPPVSVGRTRARLELMTQQVADAFGAAITAHADDWHMLQPVWTADHDRPR